MRVPRVWAGDPDLFVAERLRGEGPAPAHSLQLFLRQTERVCRDGGRLGSGGVEGRRVERGSAGWGQKAASGCPARGLRAIDRGELPACGLVMLVGQERSCAGAQSLSPFAVMSRETQSWQASGAGLGEGCSGGVVHFFLDQPPEPMFCGKLADSGLSHLA